MGRGLDAGTSLDYPSSLGMHTGMFAAKTTTELASNFTGADGALAVIGAGTPRWLLFQFSQQVF